MAGRGYGGHTERDFSTNTLGVELTAKARFPEVKAKSVDPGLGEKVVGCSNDEGLNRLRPITTQRHTDEVLKLLVGDFIKFFLNGQSSGERIDCANGLSDAANFWFSEFSLIDLLSRDVFGRDFVRVDKDVL